MIQVQLVPNNDTRVEITITKPNADGKATAVTGLTVTARVADHATATTAIASMSYVCTEYTGLRAGTYFADIPGVDIADPLKLNNATYLDTEIVVQFLESTSIAGFVRAITRATRQLA